MGTEGSFTVTFPVRSKIVIDNKYTGPSKNMHTFGK
jgi:hypothetical protein